MITWPESVFLLTRQVVINNHHALTDAAKHVQNMKEQSGRFFFHVKMRLCDLEKKTDS
jgi:hypothetical protein